MQTAPKPRDTLSLGKRLRPITLKQGESAAFKKPQISRHRKYFCKALKVKPDALPKFLLLDHAVPLEKNLVEKLAARFDVPEEGPQRKELHGAVRYYCQSAAYMAAVIKGRRRVTIDLEQDELIRREQRGHARKALDRARAEKAEHRKQRRKKGRKPPKRPAQNRDAQDTGGADRRDSSR